MKKQSFFDELAPKWDEMSGPEGIARAESWVESVSLPENRPVRTILDIGCGTGVSSAAWLQRLGEGAKVFALDNALEMLKEGRKARHTDGICWFCSTAGLLPMADESADMVVALHVWPHLPDKETTLNEWWRVLRPGGDMWITHLRPRSRINEIHSHASNPVIHKDLLPPVEDLVSTVETAGFGVLETEDSGSRYVLRATKPR